MSFAILNDLYRADFNPQFERMKALQKGRGTSSAERAFFINDRRMIKGTQRHQINLMDVPSLGLNRFAFEEVQKTD